MYILTILYIFAFVSNDLALATFEDSVNVGTVLFAPSDLRKSHWSKTELGLLKARRHFQGLLPPPNFIDTTNEGYVNTLLNYFKDTYSSIKREASCSTADSLMTTAFSDALGGYLNLWVLPISKLAFYGGTVSQDNILKLYRFHDEIKRFLNTDGKGWQNPDRNLLHTVTINVSPPRHLTRSMNNPCNLLAYYEKTNNGLTIPTPYIDWEDQSSTMFVPLRDQALIPLNSPNYPNTLFKYYDAAKSCIDESNNPEQYEFDDRFQTWLATDVVPHLSDANVYFPLGSVLTLVNKSMIEGVYDTVKQLYNSSIHTHCPFFIAGVPIDLSSKKTLIIGVILFLEIAWCIPALLCLACSRKKKIPKKKSKSIYTFFENIKNRKYQDKDGRGGGFFKSSSNKTGKNTGKGRGLKIQNRPRSENLELASQFFPSNSKTSEATDTGSYFGSNIQSAVSVVCETQPTPLKSSLKRLRSTHTSTMQQKVNMKQSIKTCTTGTEPSKCEISLPTQSRRSGSYTIYNGKRSSSANQVEKPVQNVLSNTTHIISSSGHKAQEITSKETSVNPVPTGESASNFPCLLCVETGVDSETTIVNQVSLRAIEVKSKETSLSPVPTKETASDCPCLTCLETGVDSAITIVNQESQANIEYSDKETKVNMEEEGRPDVTVKPKNNKNIGLKLESGRPYLEIMIDKPQTGICVGIGGIFDPLRGRRSKIPKRLPTTTAVPLSVGTSVMKKESTVTYKAKSHIPQPRKRPADDSVIKPRNKPKDRLNETL